MKTKKYSVKIEGLTLIFDDFIKASECAKILVSALISKKKDGEPLPKCSLREGGIIIDEVYVDDEQFLFPF